MVTRSVTEAKTNEGKVSVKALSLSAVNSFRGHLFQGERGAFWTFVPIPDMSQKSQSRIGTGHEDCETETSGNT